MNSVKLLKKQIKKDIRIIGIDSSSRSIAASIFERKNEQIFLIDTIKIDYSDVSMKEKLLIIGSSIPYLLKNYGPIDHVFIEQPIYIQNPQTSRLLSQIVGHIWGVTLQHTDASEVIISEWKKFIGYKNVSASEKKMWVAEMGEKEARKKATLERKQRTINIIHKKIKNIDHIVDNDVADAISIGLYGVSQI